MSTAQATLTRLSKEGASARPRRRPRILVAGLGNLLLMDDGVGVHAVRELGRELRGARAVEVGTAVLDALHLFERADRILAIDAVEAGGAPGTIYRFALGEMAGGARPASLHELSLVGALGLLNGHRPEVTILGIEPALIDFGLDLSPQVARALPLLISEVRRLVGRWTAC